MKNLIKYNNLSFWLIITQFIMSCQEVVHLDGKEEAIPVLNCLLCPDSTQIRIEVSYTTKVNSDYGFVPEKNATVQIEEEGKNLVTAIFDTVRSIYITDYQVKNKFHYKIKVSLPSGQQLWGETQIPIEPSEVRITIDTSAHLFHFTHEWRNISQEKQYCWIKTCGHDQYAVNKQLIMRYMESPSPLIDPFNLEVDSDYEIINRYYGYMRIENSFSEEYPISVYSQMSKDPDTLCTSLIISDKNYDLYLKSYLLNRLRREDMIDLPIFYEPSFTYSNIYGGIGIVGAYCDRTERRRFKHKNPYVPEEE